MQQQLPAAGFYDHNGVFHPTMPVAQQQLALTPQPAQRQVAAHVAGQDAGQGVLVVGQARQQISATNSRTGDPKFEFDANAQEYVKRN